MRPHRQIEDGNAARTPPVRMLSGSSGDTPPLPARPPVGMCGRSRYAGGSRYPRSRPGPCDGDRLARHDRGLAQLRISGRLAGPARRPPPDGGDHQHTQPQQYPTQLRQLRCPRATSPPCAPPRRHPPPPGARRPARSASRPPAARPSPSCVLLCVMKMNCTLRDISRTMSQKRPMLLSSSGASTSSSRQNGAGFKSKIENTSATAVSAFSPPDSWLMVLLRLPGGRAMTDTPAARRLLARRAPGRRGRRRTAAETSP